MLKLACSPELVRLKVFPDAKELTESFAANNAIRTHLAEEYPPGWADVVCYALTRGAALFRLARARRCLIFFSF